MSSWGKMRPETLRTWLGLFGDGQDRRKDYLSWLCGYFRTGNRLKDRQKQALICSSRRQVAKAAIPRLANPGNGLIESS